MWEEILRLAVGNGLWAVLFCVLLFYLIKDSKRREEKYVSREDKYISIINALGDRLKAVDAVRTDVAEIKKLITPKPQRSTRGCDKAVQLSIEPSKPLNKTA